VYRLHSPACHRSSFLLAVTCTNNSPPRLNMSDRQSRFTAVKEKLPNEAGDAFVSAM
jgi:hypothetical protein